MTTFEKLKKVTEIGGLFFILAYGVGFLTWNIYLAQFGYFESDFLQTRFLSSGLLIVLIFFPLINFLFPRFVKSMQIKGIKQFFLQTVLIFLVWALYILFIRMLFPTIPQYIGGALPFAKSVVASPEEITFLTQFNIPSVRNAEGKDSVQTGILCEIYSNKDTIILGTTGVSQDALRVLILNKTDFKGYQATPPLLSKGVVNILCKPFMFEWGDFLHIESWIGI